MNWPDWRRCGGARSWRSPFCRQTRGRLNTKRTKARSFTKGRDEGDQRDQRDEGDESIRLLFVSCWRTITWIGRRGYSLLDPFCHPCLTVINSSTSVQIKSEVVLLSDLGRRLRAYRMANGVRRTPTANFFGVSSTTLYFWEQGEIIPSGPRRKLLVELLEGKRVLEG